MCAGAAALALLELPGSAHLEHLAQPTSTMNDIIGQLEISVDGVFSPWGSGNVTNVFFLTQGIGYKIFL